jgi:[NiFe] hydrogenase diaphorase moiety small subunit
MTPKHILIKPGEHESVPVLHRRQTPNMTHASVTIDGQIIAFTSGQTLMEAATAAGIYIPHLCHNPAFRPHGSCKLCTVQVNGRYASACTFPAAEGQDVLNDTPALNQTRRSITQLLFVEGNHFCPGCEISGNCQLQAVGYHLGMLDNHFPQFFPRRRVDASHPEVMLDLDRCILCELCVRASRDVDGKHVFGIAGRGMDSRLVVNAESGRLGDTDLAVTDKAVHVCPVGAILVKRIAYRVPIGQRRYDGHDISEVSLKQDRGAEGDEHDE